MKGILIDAETGDLLVTGQSLVPGDTDSQTMELVLVTAPGEWKESPLLGANVRAQLGGQPDPMWPGQARKMIQSQGVDVQRIDVARDGTITIQ
mgnify:CR=1 FL=1